MWHPCRLVLKWSFRTPLFWVCALIAALIPPATLAFSAPTPKDAVIIRFELAVYLLVLFVGFVCSLSASRTLSTDRISGRLWLLRTRPLRSLSLVFGLWLGVFMVAVALVSIGLLSSLISLRIGLLRAFSLKKPSGYHIPLSTHTLRSLASFLPLSLPHLNTALVGDVSEDRERKTSSHRILWLDVSDPKIVFDFEGAGEALQLRTVVARALKTDVLLEVRTEKDRISKKVEVFDERSVTIDFPISGSTEVAVSLLPESNPVGFRMWEDEMGLPVTAPLVVERSAAMWGQVILLWGVMVIKSALFCAAGILCASFLSPAISSLFAAFLFFIFSSAHYLHRMGTDVAASPHHKATFVRIVSEALTVITSVVPAVGRYQPVQLLTKEVALTLSYLFETFGYFGFYTVVVLALALLLYLKPPHEITLLERE